MEIGGESAGGSIEEIEAGFRSHPTVVFFVDINMIDPVVCQAVSRGRLMTEMNEPVPAIIQQVDSAAVGADPQVAFLIFGYRSHTVAAQTVRVGGLVPEAGEIVLCPIEPIQSIDCPDPQVMLLIFTDAPDIAIAEGG